MAKLKGFSFATAPRIISEFGASSLAGGVMRSLGCRNVGVVTDKGVRANRLLDTTMRALDEADVNCHVYDDIVADPPLECVLDAAAWATTKRVDGIIGFGGGSPLDVAKLVAFLCGDTEQHVDDIWGVDACRGRRLPLVQYPTTAGTGSEVTPIAIITTGANQKKGVVSQQLLPDVAICDGELTLSVPTSITAYTAIDAMVHCIEAYTSALKKNPLSDVLAREGLRALGGNIRAVCADGSHRDARQQMLYGSTLAGMAFANAPVGAVHALAYPIGASFKVPHGLSNALMLPHVLRFNGLEGPHVDAMYGEVLGDAFPDLAAENDAARTSGGGSMPVGRSSELMAAGFEQLAADLGVQSKLSQVGIRDNDVPQLAADAMQQTRLLPNNPRALGEVDAIDLYARAL